jgi:eukaryotic-like serine/threonine-protein kinase
VELCVGNLLGDYEIIGHIGSGGAGHVYRVRHTLTDRIEAIKVLHLDSELVDQQTERFEREIKVQASLQHPNIAAVYNAQRIDGRLVMVMEYVDGRDLGKVIEERSLTLRSIIDITMQALDALEYAHSQNLIHRDIKPENILVTAKGTVKLTDFGLVKRGQGSELTRTSAPMGSVWYISPEQVKADKEIDFRADLYSLGAVLYELVTGQPPFPGDNFYKLMRAHAEQAPRRPMEIAHHLPGRLDATIMKALEKDPDRRFCSAAEFRCELEALLSERSKLLVEALRTAAARPQNALGGWWRLPAVVAAVALVFGLVATISGWALRERPLLELAVPSTTAAIRPPESAYWRTLPEGLDALLPETPKPRRPRPAAKRLVAAPIETVVEEPAPDPPVEEPVVQPAAVAVTAELPEPPPPKPDLSLLARLAVGSQTRQVALSPSGRRLIAVADHSVKVWDSGSGEVEFETNDLGEVLTAAAISAADELLFAGDRNGTVRVWRLSDRQELAALGHKSGVTAITVGDAGRILIVSLQDRSIHFWRTETSDGKYRRASKPVKRKNGAPQAIAYSSGDNRLAATSNDRQIQIWKAPGGGKSVRIESPTSGFSEVTLSSDGVLVAAAGENGVELWHVASRRKVANLQTGARNHDLSFPPSRRCISAAGGGRTVRIWDVVAATPLVEAVTESIVADVSLTPDARRVAALDQSGVVYVWQMNQEALDRLQEPFSSEEIAQRIKGQPTSKPERRGVLGRIKGFVQ